VLADLLPYALSLLLAIPVAWIGALYRRHLYGRLNPILSLVGALAIGFVLIFGALGYKAAFLKRAGISDPVNVCSKASCERPGSDLLFLIAGFPLFTTFSRDKKRD
jgi:hypothetical protein